ncbi:MAG: hypothetical protein DI551_06475 [Micavibrio aeruginosavorus]|uniref:Uncharacterized protein n=1 Tax=Micavibrio aeruginosavorus TaxID=349221 RepID=A0A2W5Q366_9BACT|nr:MAG: hypothetical protein DI551_06475 [Micavibrio aeruginosavorus]
MTVYRSTLSPRERSIDRASFEDAPHLSFNHYSAGDSIDSNTIDLWERSIPYTPLQMYEVFTAGYDQENVEVNLNIFPSGMLQFKIEHEEDGRKIFTSALSIYTTLCRSIHGSKVVVDPDHQGQGIGRTSMRNWIETAAAFWFEAFSFEAAMDDGGLVWAKMGAHLDRDEERQPHYVSEEEALFHVLNARLEAARPFIGRENYEIAREYCRIQEPDALVQLAAMGDVVVPREAAVEAEQAVMRYYLYALGGAKDVIRAAKQEISHLASIFNPKGQGSYEYVSLSAFLQKKIMWSGVVGFSNTKQMEDVGEYLYGWNTLEPSAP